MLRTDDRGIFTESETLSLYTQKKIDELMVEIEDCLPLKVLSLTRQPCWNVRRRVDGPSKRGASHQQSRYLEREGVLCCNAGC